MRASLSCSKNSISTLKLNSLSMIMMLALDALAIKMYTDKKMESDLLISICIMSYTFSQYYSTSISKTKSIMHYLAKYQELKSHFETFKFDKVEANNCIQVKNGEIMFKNVHVIHDEKQINKQS